MRLTYDRLGRGPGKLERAATDQAQLWTREEEEEEEGEEKRELPRLRTGRRFAIRVRELVEARSASEDLACLIGTGSGRADTSLFSSPSSFSPVQ
jgi:hypothetical protein